MLLLLLLSEQERPERRPGAARFHPGGMTTTGARFSRLLRSRVFPSRGLEARIAFWLRALANHQEQQMTVSADRLAAREDKINA